MRTNKTVSHIYYELDHDVQEYAKRLLAKKILHAAQQDNAVPFPDETAKRIAETAVFLTERLTLLYEVSSGFRGIRFSDSGKQPAVYTTMVQRNAPLYDEPMLGRAYNLASFLAAESPDIREVVLMKHGVLAAIYNAAAHMKERTPEPGKISVQSQLFVSTAVELFDGLLSTAVEKKNSHALYCSPDTFSIERSVKECLEPIIGKKTKGIPDDQQLEAYKELCRYYYDTRMFGLVNTSYSNIAGQQNCIRLKTQ